MFNSQKQFLRTMIFSMILAFLSALAYAPDAEARRFGGGSSLGKSGSSGLFGKSSTTNKSTSQATNQKSSSTPAKKPFMGGMLGGLVAGLGLAALFSMLGFGEGMASFLGTLLLVGGAIFLALFVYRLLKKQKQSAYAGATAGSNQTYRQNFQYQPPGGSSSNSSFGHVQPELSSPQNELPVDFDQEKFLENAKQFFVMIQKEFDHGNLEQLKQYCTDDVLAYAQSEIQQRNGAENVTSVVNLQANIIGYEQTASEELVTVEFNAMLREEQEQAPIDVTEHWVLTRSTQGGGWLLAGVHTV